MKKYSFLRGLWKGILSFLIFLLPALIQFFPQYADMSLLDAMGKLFPVLKFLSIGAAIVIIVNFLKIQYNNLKNR